MFKKLFEAIEDDELEISNAWVDNPDGVDVKVRISDTIKNRIINKLQEGGVEISDRPHSYGIRFGEPYHGMTWLSKDYFNKPWYLCKENWRGTLMVFATIDERHSTGILEIYSDDVDRFLNDIGVNPSLLDKSIEEAIDDDNLEVSERQNTAVFNPRTHEVEEASRDYEEIWEKAYLEEDGNRVIIHYLKAPNCEVLPINLQYLWFDTSSDDYIDDPIYDKKLCDVNSVNDIIDFGLAHHYFNNWQWDGRVGRHPLQLICGGSSDMLLWGDKVLFNYLAMIGDVCDVEII